MKRISFLFSLSVFLLFLSFSGFASAQESPLLGVWKSSWYFDWKGRIKPPSRAIVLVIRKDDEGLKALYTLANHAPFSYAEPREYKLDVKELDGSPYFYIGIHGTIRFSLKGNKLYGKAPDGEATLEKERP